MSLMMWLILEDSSLTGVLLGKHQTRTYIVNILLKLIKNVISIIEGLVLDVQMKREVLILLMKVSIICKMKRLISSLQLVKLTMCHSTQETV